MIIYVCWLIFEVFLIINLSDLSISFHFQALRGLYHSKRHDGASGWKTLQKSVKEQVVTKLQGANPDCQQRAGFSTTFVSTAKDVFNDFFASVSMD